VGVISTHLTGTFLAAQAAQKVMVPQRYGKMVFLSSTSAQGNRGQNQLLDREGRPQGMARTLAIELGRFGINVNAVAPGFIRDADDRGHGPAHGSRLGGLQEGRRRAHAGAPRREAIDIANTVRSCAATTPASSPARRSTCGRAVGASWRTTWSV